MCLSPHIPQHTQFCVWLERRAGKGPEFQPAAPVEFYMPLVVTGQVPQFLASLSEKDAEQTVKICNRNLTQKEAHPVKWWQILRKMQDLNLDASHWSFPLAKPGNFLALGAVYLPSSIAQLRNLIWNFALHH